MSDYAPHPHEEHIPHYHGDAVRQLFISAAALMLIGAPFYADSLRTELPFEIVGALILVALAALANPHKKLALVADAIAAGVGLVIYETWALYTYHDSTWMQFILREVIAIIFLAAFYFSMKTVRAFVLHQVGRHDEAGEFEEGSSPTPVRQEGSWHDEFTPWFLRSGNSRNKDSKNNKKEKEAGKEEETETGPRMSPGRSSEEVKPKYHPYEYM